MIALIAEHCSALSLFLLCIDYGRTASFSSLHVCGGLEPQMLWRPPGASKRCPAAAPDSGDAGKLEAEATASAGKATWATGAAEAVTYRKKAQHIHGFG